MERAMELREPSKVKQIWKLVNEPLTDSGVPNYLCLEICSMNRTTHFAQACAHCFCATQGHKAAAFLSANVAKS